MVEAHVQSGLPGLLYQGFGCPASEVVHDAPHLDPSCLGILQQLQEFPPRLVVGPDVGFEVEGPGGAPDPIR